MDKKLHRLDTFRVQDLHGTVFKVHAYEHLTQVSNLLDMRAQWEPTGEVEYKLSTGEHLELDDDGTMYVLGSSMPLHRVSPTAHVM
jgi:hypothetical protein